jgi:hypothetical protein
MAGLVPAIHVLMCCNAAKTWMPGTRPGMTNHMRQPDLCADEAFTESNGIVEGVAV